MVLEGVDDGYAEDRGFYVDGVKEKRLRGPVLSRLGSDELLSAFCRLPRLRLAHASETRNNVHNIIEILVNVDVLR